MDASDQKRSLVRSYVLGCGLIGLALTLVLAFARDGGTSGLGDVAFVAVFAGPFVLALLSLALARLEHQRRVWAASAVLTAGAGLPLVFNGVGFFFLAIAIGFGWAVVTTRPRRLSSR